MGTAPPAIFLQLMASFPSLQGLFVSDTDGVILYQATRKEAKTAFTSSTATSFSLAVSQASKLALGESQTVTAYYADSVIVHASLLPLLVTVVASPVANTGVITNRILPDLRKKLEPLRKAAQEEMENELRAEEENSD
jgi:predicted regulator of Ras-like GTPase activity (Roadblock/LC7/MglB family)